MQTYIPDTLSYVAAMKLRDKLNAIWHSQGLRGAEARVVCEDCTGGHRPIYVIRSNVTFDDKGYLIVKPRRLELLP